MTEVSSETDQRTINNTTRHKYRVLTDEEKAQMTHIKDLGAELIEYIENLPSQEDGQTVLSRDKANAIDRIQEGVMWAVRHVTK
tara:strand:+ start:386 stop:637 length:252 start_codon:yes stop_codon:yes gene_type:complete